MDGSSAIVVLADVPFNISFLTPLPFGEVQQQIASAFTDLRILEALKHIGRLRQITIRLDLHPASITVKQSFHRCSPNSDMSQFRCRLWSDQFQKFKTRYVSGAVCQND